MEEKVLFKEVYNEALVQNMASNLKSVYNEFKTDEFVEAIVPQLAPLSLSERSNCIKENLYTFLPKDYPEALKIILDSFDKEIKDSELTGLSGFYYMPFGSYISNYGIEEKYYELSMHALYELTKRFTSEGPIRPFIRKYPERTLTTLHEWTKDENVHVRRLVSEGTRPKLPWASPLKEFQKDPTEVLKLLEKLKEDDELYVRRSVANNLNDIAKDHPDLVVETLQKWSKIKNKGTQWILSHASRTLLKQGHPKALELLGYPKDISIEVSDFELSDNSVKMGAELNFTFTIHSKATKEQNLMVDFVVDFMKANGKQAPKVFKLSKKKIKAGEKLLIKKKLSFKPISTRKYYAGTHGIQIQINGNLFDRLEFELVD